MPMPPPPTRPTARALRPFIGCRDYATSRAFYRALGFTEVELGPRMCLLRWDERVAFYLQDAYVEEWVDNTMVFLEVDDLDSWHAHLTHLGLPERFAGVRLSSIREEDWGRECFLHDPAGVLWHVGSFGK